MSQHLLLIDPAQMVSLDVGKNYQVQLWSFQKYQIFIPVIDNFAHSHEIDTIKSKKSLNGSFYVNVMRNLIDCEVLFVFRS